MNAPTLHTDRLTLCGHRTSDMSEWMEFCTSDASVHIIGPLDEHRAWTFFAESVAQWALFGFGTFIVDGADGNFVGQVSLSKRPGYPEHELCWILYPKVQGQGSATQAAQKVSEYVQTKNPSENIVGCISPAEPRSIRLAERLGANLDETAPLPDWSPCRVYRYPSPITDEGIQVQLQ